MKTACAILILLLVPTSLLARIENTPDQRESWNSSAVVDTAAKPAAIETPPAPRTHRRWNTLGDSLFYSKYNKYGDLRDDDPEFSPKKPWWVVGLRVTGSNVVTTAADRYLLRYDYAKVGFNSWSHNLRSGWEWDTDRFGMNFFFHPYSGAGYFNHARCSGYNFYQALPFAVGGSVMYEYFGENTLPSINDAINTPIGGAFLGEIFYRLSSNILDDRTTGRGRFFRELGAAAVDPWRGIGRLTSGTVSRHTSKEIYQKEPLNITLSAGARQLNSGSSFGSESVSGTFNLDIDYGNPFEKRSRKPFDYFTLRTDLNYGVGRKMLDNIVGLGILSGTNIRYKSVEMLAGLFQHYDYWDNKSFELGVIAFGGGVVSKVPLFAGANLFTDVHLGVVPLAGNSTKNGPDTLQVRDYNYGGGLEGKVESTLEWGKRADATFSSYYYWIHTFVGDKEDHFMALIRPRVEVRFIKNLSLGFEHLVYYSERHQVGFSAVHGVQTEERVFLKVLFEQFKRKE